MCARTAKRFEGKPAEPGWGLAALARLPVWAQKPGFRLLAQEYRHMCMTSLNYESSGLNQFGSLQPQWSLCHGPFCSGDVPWQEPSCWPSEKQEAKYPPHIWVTEVPQFWRSQLVIFLWLGLVTLRSFPAVHSTS